MKPAGVRAVVLAAGRGRRLRPLTDFLPKPLLPVAGTPVVAQTLRQLERAGCEAAALNLHHKGEMIRERLGGAMGSMRLHYSHEEELLGTLGALGGLRDFVAEARLLVVVNGDSLTRWPVRRLVRRHLKSGAAATLLLARRADPEAFGAAVGIDAGGRILAFGDSPRAEGIMRRRVFAGCHVFAPSLVAGVPALPAGFVGGLYLPLLERGETLRGVEFSGRWHDLGTPERYLAGCLDLARGRYPARLWRRSRVASGARVAEGARLRRAVVESGAQIEAGATLERAVVLPGAVVGEGCRVRRAIVGPGVSLPAGTVVEGRLVTPVRADVPPRAWDSVVGGLAYSPLAGERDG